MANAFTLDDLHAALDKKYGPFTFKAGRETFTLNQVLRISKEKRAVVKAQLQMLDEKRDELTEDEMLVILKAIVENIIEGDRSDRLFEVLDNDLAKVTVLFEKWVEHSQAGEA